MLVDFFVAWRTPLAKNTVEGSPRTRSNNDPSVWRLFEDAFLVLFHFYPTSDHCRTLFDKRKGQIFDKRPLFLSGILSTREVARICRIPTNLSHCSLTVYALRVSSKIRKRTSRNRHVAWQSLALKLFADQSNPLPSKPNIKSRLTKETTILASNSFTGVIHLKTIMRTTCI